MSNEQTHPETPPQSAGGEPTPSSVSLAASHEAIAMHTSPESPTAADRVTIGKSLQIKGEVIGTESLYIDGKVEGAIKLPGNRVTVSRDAHVSANITAREVVVFGKVSGNIYASDCVDLRSEGSVTGDVTAQRITVGDGAFFDGGIHIGKPGKQEDRDVHTEISSNDPRKVPIAVPA
jgi:cytoskeletal protein CcmA (bactofilin family)